MVFSSTFVARSSNACAGTLTDFKDESASHVTKQQLRTYAGWKTRATETEFVLIATIISSFFFGGGSEHSAPSFWPILQGQTLTDSLSNAVLPGLLKSKHLTNKNAQTLDHQQMHHSNWWGQNHNTNWRPRSTMQQAGRRDIPSHWSNGEAGFTTPRRYM